MVSCDELYGGLGEHYLKIGKLMGGIDRVKGYFMDYVWIYKSHPTQLSCHDNPFDLPPEYAPADFIEGGKELFKLLHSIDVNSPDFRAARNKLFEMRILLCKKLICDLESILEKTLAERLSEDKKGVIALVLNRPYGGLYEKKEILGDSKSTNLYLLRDLFIVWGGQTVKFEMPAVFDDILPEQIKKGLAEYKRQYEILEEKIVRDVFPEIDSLREEFKEAVAIHGFRGLKYMAECDGSKKREERGEGIDYNLTERYDKIYNELLHNKFISERDTFIEKGKAELDALIGFLEETAS